MLLVALLEEWRGEEKMLTPKIDGWDELNLALNESSGQGKTHLDFFKSAWWFGAKIMPPKTPHGMSECLGPPLV